MKRREEKEKRRRELPGLGRSPYCSFQKKQLSLFIEKSLNPSSDAACSSSQFTAAQCDYLLINITVSIEQSTGVHTIAVTWQTSFLGIASSPAAVTGTMPSGAPYGIHLTRRNDTGSDLFAIELIDLATSTVVLSVTQPSNAPSFRGAWNYSVSGVGVPKPFAMYQLYMSTLVSPAGCSQTLIPPYTPAPVTTTPSTTTDTSTGTATTPVTSTTSTSPSQTGLTTAPTVTTTLQSTSQSSTAATGGTTPVSTSPTPTGSMVTPPPSCGIEPSPVLQCDQE
jgi:hypothetical protein